MNHYQNNLDHINSELKRVQLLLESASYGAYEANSDSLLEYQKLYTENKEKREIAKQQNIELRLITLANDFKLSDQEIEILLICLFAYSSTASKPLFRELNYDKKIHGPTINLILDLLFSIPEEQIKARSYFIPTAPLFANNIIQFIEPDKRLDIARTNRQLRLADRVADYLFDHDYLDSAIQPFARLVAADTTLDDLVVPKEAKEELNQFATWHANQDADEKPFVCNIHGVPGTVRYMEIHHS